MTAHIAYLCIQKWPFNVIVFNSQICRKMGIIEVDYFGLQFTGTKGEVLWVNLRNRISQQVDSLSPCRLRLRVKFFVEPHLILQEQTRWNYTKVKISCNILILLLIVFIVFPLLQKKKKQDLSVAAVFEVSHFCSAWRTWGTWMRVLFFFFFLSEFCSWAQTGNSCLKWQYILKYCMLRRFCCFVLLTLTKISMHLFIWCLSFTSVAGSYLCTCLLLKLALFQVRECLM